MCRYKTVSVADTEEANIRIYFPECIDFIRSGIAQSGRVLVHCYAGLSRSVTIVAAYLMQTHRVTADEALRMIRSKRPYSEPNPGFLRQLKEFEREIQNLPDAVKAHSRDF